MMEEQQIVPTSSLDDLLRLPTPLDACLESEVTTTVQLKTERSRNAGNKEALDQVEAIDDALKKKLYHQFTDAVVAYLFEARFASCWQRVDDAVTFLLHVVKPVMAKLSSLTLLQAVRRVADTMKGLSGLKFLELWRPAMIDETDTLLLFKSVQAFHLLHGGFVRECEEFLFDHLQPQLEATFGIAGPVQAEFNRAAAAYCWRVNDLDNFYKHGMFFLQGADLNTMLLEDKIEIARNLCRAVILSPKIFSFIELLQHDILNCISPGGPGFPSRSLPRDLLVICNSGDHVMFDIFVQERRAVLEAESLTAELPSIEKKVTIFALLELAFLKPQRERVLTFDEIAKACRIEKAEVEQLVIKVMCHGLMKGSIDQVRQTVAFTALQPRVLDSAKIRALSEHFRGWAKSCQSVATSLEGMLAV